MSNPKKIYLSPPYPDNLENNRDWATNRVDEDWVEYVSIEEIKKLISYMKDDINSDNDLRDSLCQVYPIPEPKKVLANEISKAIIIKSYWLNELKKLIEK